MDNGNLNAESKRQQGRSKQKNIKNQEGQRKRLREKFTRSGISGFHDYEIVELLLTLGTPRKDCQQQAKDEIEFVTQCLKQGKPLPDSYIFNFSSLTLIV